MQDTKARPDPEFARLVDAIVKRHAESFQYLATR